MVDPGRKKPKVNKMTKVLKELEEKYTFITPEDIEVLYVYDDRVYIQGETKIKAEVEKIVRHNENKLLHRGIKPF